MCMFMCSLCIHEPTVPKKELQPQEPGVKRTQLHVCKEHDLIITIIIIIKTTYHFQLEGGDGTLI
jgi:hypothetical protein